MGRGGIASGRGTQALAASSDASACYGVSMGGRARIGQVIPLICKRNLFICKRNLWPGQWGPLQAIGQGRCAPAFGHLAFPRLQISRCVDNPIQVVSGDEKACFMKLSRKIFTALIGVLFTVSNLQIAHSEPVYQNALNFKKGD